MPAGSRGLSKGAVAATIIVKDAKDHLEKTFASIEDSGVDEIVIVDTGSVDGTDKIAEKLASTFARYVDPDPLDLGSSDTELSIFAENFKGQTCLSDFSAARNFANSLVKSEYIFWIDSDDTLSDPKAFREYIDNFVRPGQFDAHWMIYDYEHDEHGRCCMRHPAVRIARLENFVWRSPIHEVLCAIYESRYCNVQLEEARIIHNSTVNHKNKAFRNARVAENFARKNEWQIEPRLWLNYGKSLHALGLFRKSIDAINRYLGGSQWNEERYHAFLIVADAWKKLHNYESAFDNFFRAIRLMPDYKEGWIELAKLYYQLDENEKCLVMADIADSMERDNSGYKVNPLQIAFGTSKLRSFAYSKLFKFKEAIEEADKVLKEYPFDKEVMSNKVLSAQMLRRDELKHSYRQLEFMIQLEGDSEKLDYLVKSVPRAIENEPEIPKPVEVEVSNKPKIAFMCGETAKTWGHNSIEKGGIGGSETAVIYMSKELSKLGWHVEVYGYMEPNQEGLHDGVVWMPYWRYPYSTEPNIYVAWREPSWISHEQRTKNRYVWLHDVGREHSWKPEIQRGVTGVFVLSQAHRKTVPWLPDEKIIYSANGLDKSFHRELRNEPHRMIFASSPDRGLQHLLPLWDRIRERCPKAQLDIFYGFNRYFYEFMRKSEAHREVYNIVQDNVSKPGINFHGMVSQGELAEAFSLAGVWVYPTSFYEISCITAMQAQANGAVPVATAYAALDETIQHGLKVGDTGTPFKNGLEEKWLEALFSVLGNKQEQERLRLPMVPWARNKFLWCEVAKQWDTIFRAQMTRSTAIPSTRLQAVNT